MNKNLLVQNIRNFAIKNSESDDLHGFAHVERVYNNCMKLGKELEADLLILGAAALLHDIGRIREHKPEYLGQNHAQISADIAETYLNSLDSGFSKEVIDSISRCIKSHSFSSGYKPETLEAKILSDMDKLDALGAIGLYRTIGFTLKRGGDLEKVIEHLENKIMKLKGLMYLEASHQLAEGRHQIILDFYNNIKKEK